MVGMSIRQGNNQVAPVTMRIVRGLVRESSTGGCHLAADPSLNAKRTLVGVSSDDNIVTGGIYTTPTRTRCILLA